MVLLGRGSVVGCGSDVQHRLRLAANHTVGEALSVITDNAFVVKLTEQGDNHVRVRRLSQHLQNLRVAHRGLLDLSSWEPFSLADTYSISTQRVSQVVQKRFFMNRCNKEKLMLRGVQEGTAEEAEQGGAAAMSTRESPGPHSKEEESGAGE